jgi:hypothetical protein
MLDAALASLRLLNGDEDAPRRRVVISADVDDAVLRPDLDYSVVRLAGPIEFTEIRAIHMDTADAEAAISAAVAVIDAADMGDHDAEFLIGEAEDHDLAWYAPQEIAFVLDLM